MNNDQNMLTQWVMTLYVYQWAAGLRDYGVPTDPRAFATKPPKKNTEIPQQIANPREGVHYDFFCNCTKHPPPEEGSQWKPGDFYFETLQQELPKKLPFKPIFPGFEVFIFVQNSVFSKTKEFPTMSQFDKNINESVVGCGRKQLAA